MSTGLYTTHSHTHHTHKHSLSRHLNQCSIGAIHHHNVLAPTKPPSPARASLRQGQLQPPHLSIRLITICPATSGASSFPAHSVSIQPPCAYVIVFCTVSARHGYAQIGTPGIVKLRLYCTILFNQLSAGFLIVPVLFMKVFYY